MIDAFERTTPEKGLGKAVKRKGLFQRFRTSKPIITTRSHMCKQLNNTLHSNDSMHTASSTQD